MSDSDIQTGWQRPAPVRAGWLVSTIVLALALLSPCLYADVPRAIAETGLPFIHNFVPSVYGGSPQNWAITQGSDGVMYFGNVSDGVLSFDGTRWQRTPVTNNFVVRSLATAPDGRIYVGTVGDFGFLDRDADGKQFYHSLLSHVPEAARDFSDVWATHVVGDDIYFATLEHLFRWHEGAISVLDAKTSFHLSFNVEGALYIREGDHGLMRADGDTLALVNGGEQLAHERIYAMLPWRGANAQPGELLIGTRTNGWMRYDDGVITPWATEADAELESAGLYGASWLKDGRLVAITLRGGVLVLDGEGRLLRRINRASGLPTDVIFGHYQDRQRGLWLVTGDGISRVEIDSPLTHFSESAGLRGAVLAIVRHHGSLYTGTTEGLYRLVPGSGDFARFDNLPQSPDQNWALLSVDDALLAVGNEGVFAIAADGSSRQIVTEREGHALAGRTAARSRQDPSRIFIGFQDGIGSLRRDGMAWIDEGRIAGAETGPISMLEPEPGTLWVTLWRGGIQRIVLPADWRGPSDPRPLVFERFGAADGVPGGQQDVVAIDGEARFLTAQGIYRFDEGSRRFVADAKYARLFGGEQREISNVHEDAQGRLWLATLTHDNLRQTGYAIGDGDAWHFVDKGFQPLDSINTTRFLDDPDGVVWIGGDRGMFRYDSQRPRASGPEFNALIRKVSTHDGRIVHAGGAAFEPPRIPYDENALRFEFAAPSYDFFEANRFQVLLRGVDPGWSPWSGDAYRDYTNLHEGTYRFDVRARNIYGDETAATTFVFRVLPPWYRTLWAWAIWLASAALLVLLLLRWRSAALRRRNRELTQLVEERTQALKLANAALAEQTVTDPLTGLKNRRYLYHHIEQDLAVLKRKRRDQRAGGAHATEHDVLVFLMLDIDHFKEINDAFGHAAGDAVLEQFGSILKINCRDSDIPVRWGGEEFLLVARFAAPDTGPQFAERVRAAVAEFRFDLGDGRHIHRTCSIGFACFPPFDEAPDALAWEQVVNLADECMYAAKRHGRNAWAGVMPMTTPPVGDITEALRADLDGNAVSAPFALRSSWDDAAQRQA